MSVSESAAQLKAVAAELTEAVGAIEQAKNVLRDKQGAAASILGDISALEAISGAVEQACLKGDETIQSVLEAGNVMGSVADLILRSGS